MQRLCFALLAFDCLTPPQPLPFAALSPTAPELAAEALRSANNGFVLLCAALVLLMTPALSLFYGGFVRSRNVLNTMVMSFAAMAVVSVLWVLFGYSLVFAPSTGPLAPFIGGLQWAGLANWAEPWGEGQLSQGAVALFQLTFAIITPALVSGAVVERMHFGAWLAFLVLWSTLIYLPLAHMVWGPGGFLGPEGLGALDFAGGLVVEMASGVAVRRLTTANSQAEGSSPCSPQRLPGRNTRTTTASSRVVLTTAYTPSAWAIQKLAITTTPVIARPSRSNPQPLPDHRQVGLVQVGGEAISKLFRAEEGRHIRVGRKVGAEVAAFGVPGGVGVALHDAVGLLAGQAALHQGQQHPLAEHHTAVDIHVSGHVLGVDP